MLSYIHKEQVYQVIQTEDYKLPVSVDSHCPHCKRPVNFNLSWPHRKTYVVEYSNSHCPACQGKTTFIFLTFKRENATHHSGHLFIHPSSDYRQPLEGINEADSINDVLKKHYTSTIKVLNSGEWTATAVLCRKVLEGITKTIAPDANLAKNLFQSLEQLPNHIDLKKPILTLTDAIRRGGNLGAHFDLEKEPNSEIANLMVDLLDYLIEYIFILPNRIQSLHDKIENLSEPKS